MIVFPNSIEESENDDEEFPPLPSDIETLTYDNRHRSIDLFYCPSPPLPSPPPSIDGTMVRTYANMHTFSSIRDTEYRPFQTKITFATQFKKKARAPIAGFLEGTYVNMSVPARPHSESPPPPPTPLDTKPIQVANEVTYATLINTTSLGSGSAGHSSINSDFLINHVEYQQIQIPFKANTKPPTCAYENIKTRRAPPPPIVVCEEVSMSPLPVTVTVDSPVIADSSVHTYINVQFQDDQPPAIPSRSNKTPSDSPPLLPPRKDQNSPSNSTEAEPSESNSSTTNPAPPAQTLERNMTPHPGDKSELYRTKLPPTATPRPRRTIHSIRRRRLRGSIALRGSIRGSTTPATTAAAGRGQNSRPNSNVSVRHPMITDDRWRRTIRKRRRQRVLQMRLDGNVLPKKQTKSNRTTSDHMYNEIRQPSNRMRTSPTNTTGVLERAMQFNGALRDRVFSWYRGANPNGREELQQQQQQQQQQQGQTNKVVSTSENEESDAKEGTVNEGEDDDDEEEFFTHNTFEDFLLRRRPKSSASTTISGTSTVVSHVESVSHRLPTRSTSMHHRKPHNGLPPPPPPPLPLTPPPAVRRFPGLALGLDKTDVDFIHNILQRTRGENRVWNRITALKEAYIRATSKKNNQPKKPKIHHPNIPPEDEKKKKKAMLMKHSLAATKIRAELEKYDELPASSATIVDDDDYYYDETCSGNNRHHRSVPNLLQTPSTGHRILNFVTSIKRRAQSNVQQLQKNLQDIRSRVQNEAMVHSFHPATTSPSGATLQRNPSLPARQSRKDPTRIHPSRTVTTLNPEKPPVLRTNSHRSVTSNELPSRRMLNRTQSNTSQMLAGVRQKSRTLNPSSNASAARPGATRTTGGGETEGVLALERRSSHQINPSQRRMTKKTS